MTTGGRFIFIGQCRGSLVFTKGIGSLGYVTKPEVPYGKIRASHPIPDGYHSVTPYLIISKGKAREAIDFG